MIKGLRRKVITTIALVSMVGVLGACGGSAGDRPGASDTLTLGTFFKPTSQDASRMTDTDAWWTQAAYDTLLHLSPEGELQPWLATDWSYDKQRTTLTLTLRDDVRFVDGTALDAEAVAANLLRFRDGLSAAAGSLRSVDDVTAPDATTVRIDLEAPDPALLFFLSVSAGAIASPAAFDNADLATNPVGSGPYVLDPARTIEGSSWVYTRNEDYWAPETQHYDELVIQAYDNSSTTLNAIKAGQVDGALVDNSIVTQVEEAGYTSVDSDGPWVGMAILDRDGTQVPALGDVRVRQAINHAIDREAMLQAVDKGFGTTTTQVLSPASGVYDESLDERYPYDPDKARELLAEAGYADGFTLPMPNISAAAPVNFDLMREYLGEVGIEVEYTQLSSTNMIPELLAAKHPASWVRLGGEPSAWLSATQFLSGTAAFNPFKVSDPTIEELLAEIQGGTEKEVLDAGRRLNEYIVEQALFNPWYRPTSGFAVASGTTATPELAWSYPYLYHISPQD